MEPEEGKKGLAEEVVNFMAKRSEAEFPRYAARLRSYVDFRKKRNRASAARRHAETREKKGSSLRKGDQDQKEKPGDNVDRQGGDDDRMSRKRGGGEKCAHQSRSFSRSGSHAPSDACCRRRRRRRCCRRRRRRSRCRRRRRRCSRRRRRRRSCSRRRRRRSCRRRRRACRRRRRRRC